MLVDVLDQQFSFGSLIIVSIAAMLLAIGSVVFGARLASRMSKQDPQSDVRIAIFRFFPPASIQKRADNVTRFCDPFIADKAPLRADIDPSGCRLQHYFHHSGCCLLVASHHRPT